VQFFHVSDGTRLAYSDDGDGLPLLCLAGLTRNSKDFDFVAPHLSGIRVIRMDYRGRGASGWADSTTYNVAQEATDVLALMDHLGIQRFAILGTSRGGLIAMALGAMAPDRLLGVCFNDIGPVLELSGLEVIMTYLGKKPAAKTMAEAALARAAFMQGFDNVPATRWQQEVTHMYLETDDGLELAYDPALRQTIEKADAKGLPDLWPLFSTLAKLPCALIHGVNSNLLSAETVVKMRTVNPNLLVAEVPDRGHTPFLDEPEALEVIHAWLEQMT